MLIIIFMRKTGFYWILTLLLLLQACRASPPTNTADETPLASNPDPETGSASNNLPLAYGKNIRFEQFSLEEGLSQSVVNAILQDSKGFLWVGTDDGLNRFDGYKFTIYKPDAENTSSLSDRSITAIVEDPQGYLWIGTRQGGLNRYDPSNGKFSHYMFNPEDKNSLASNMVYSLCIDGNGLWIGTDNGLNYLDFETETFTHIFVPDDTPPNTRSLSSNTIQALFKDSNGLLWIGTGNGGVNVYNPSSGTFNVFKHDRNDPESLSNNRIFSIVESPDGSIWVGTANGLNQYNPSRNTFKRFENSRYREYSLAGNTVNALFVDQSGSLWVGTNKGLDRYDTQTNRFEHHQSQPGIPKSLSNNQVLSLYEDASGVIWVGTFGGGLNKYNRQQDRFTYYRHNPNDDNSLSSNFIHAILAEKNGPVWIGTLDNGLNRFEPGSETFFHYQSNPSIASSLSDNFIRALFMDSKGTLWVGTGKALDRYDPTTNRFRHYRPDEVSSEVENTDFSVSAIYEDSQGNLWVGSNLGLMRFDRKTLTFIPFILGPQANNNSEGFSITAILEDGSKTLWVGTFDDGLKSIDLENGLVTHYQSDPGNNITLANNSVLSLYLDSNGILWVGTHGGGLSRFNPSTRSFTSFSENEGLPNNVIYGILEDESGDLWLSTNFGLSRFTPSTQSFRNFTVSDGLQSNEFSQNAFSKDGNGTMYFGGINGLSVFKPSEIKDNLFNPNIVLTSISLEGAPLAESQTPEFTQRIVLQWPKDSFEFEFAALAYEQPFKNQYTYMLEGFDPDWIPLGSQRIGRYTNLPGGTYTLRLRGSNSDGAWSEAESDIEVVVVPPFWETWWFVGLFIIALGSTVAGALRWRVKRVELRNLELERVVRNRTADLEKRSSEIEALYQADEKIMRSMTVTHIFQTLVNVSVSLLQADSSMVLIWNEEKQKVLPRVSQGFKPESLEVIQYDRNEGKVGLAMKTGKPVIIDNIDLSDVRTDLQKMIQNEGIQSFAHFPIVVDERVVALFTVAYTRPQALTKDSIRLFTTLVNRASLSIANMQLFEQTRDLAVMEERNRLARDLHDSAKQKAFAALAQLGTVNGMAKTIPNEATPHLGEAENLVYEVIQELNFLIQEIYPIALQEKGLPNLLREYVFEWENRNDTVIKLTVENECRLPLELEQAVYRVIQEALANVSRHSRAKHVDISLKYSSDLLHVVIADNGCGFDLTQKAKGLGFRSMRERIGSVKGTFQVQSAPGAGTTIIVDIPIKIDTGVKT